MNSRGPIAFTVVGALGTVLALVLGIVIIGGGGNSLATLAPGLKSGAVPEQYREWVMKAGALCPEIPAPAIAAQIEAESNWNPLAVSSAGAEGIAQFEPTTWASWGHDENGDHDGPAAHPDNGRPQDPADAIPAQARFMCALARDMKDAELSHQATGDVLDLALAAYNAGAGAVLAAHGIPHNGQTEIYVPRIRGLMAKYELTTPLPASALGGRIVQAAESQIGLPYVWGGGDSTGPTGGGFDCSGLVMYAVFQASQGKISFPTHLADAEIQQGQLVTGPAPGAQINLSLLQPGDIIGFAEPGTSTYHHIGIYAGGGQLIHAPDFGETVKIAPLTTAYWAKQTWLVRRFGT